MSARWTATRAFAFIGAARIYLVVELRREASADSRPWKWSIAGPGQSPGADGNGESQTFEAAKRAATKAAHQLLAHLDAEKAKIDAAAAGLES